MRMGRLSWRLLNSGSDSSWVIEWIYLDYLYTYNAWAGLGVGMV
jgi:hypothetical protein